jgi:hypothetical protein
MMQIKLKTIILFSFIALLVGFILTMIISTQEVGYSVISIALSVGQISGMILYILETDIHKTDYVKYILIGFAIILIGVLFRIQHWPYGGLLIFMGLSAVLFAYFVRFLNKNNKGFIDFIKVLWIGTAFIGSYFKINHWPNGDLIIYSSSGIFWLGLIYILYHYKFKYLITEKSNKW